MQLSMHESGGHSAASWFTCGWQPSSPGQGAQAASSQACGPCTCIDCDLFLMGRPLRCWRSQRSLQQSVGPPGWSAASPRALATLTQVCVLCSAEGDAGAQAMEGDFDAGRAAMRRNVHRKVGDGLHMPPPSEGCDGGLTGLRRQALPVQHVQRSWGGLQESSGMQAQHGPASWAPHSWLDQ